jgi:hypothetical protein
MVEEKGVTPESPLEDAVASSSEAEQQTQETETPTPQEGVTPEPEEPQAEEQRVPYDRFKEKVDEANWYKQQLEAQIARQQAPQPVAPQADPYANMTPEEKVFWQNVDRRAEQKAKELFEQQISPQLEAAKKEFAVQRIEAFRKEHPEIKTNSPEEQMIAEKVRQGYFLEDAYKVVMYEKKVAEKQLSSQQQQKQRLEAKKKANVVSQQSVSQQSVKPPKETYEEEVRRKMNEMSMEDLLRSE